MNVECILDYLNNVDNWYLSRDARLCGLATNPIGTGEFEVYEVQSGTIEEAQDAFYALSSVLGTMQQAGIIIFFCMRGINGTISYYYGISIDTTYNLDAQTRQRLLSEAGTVFMAAYAGNFPSNGIQKLSMNEKSMLLQTLYSYAYAGILEGVPGLFSTTSKINGANNVKKAMQMDDFMMISLARPLSLRQNNCLSCNVEHISTELQPLANRTENCVTTDSTNNSFNVNAGQFYSCNLIRGNTEIRREYAFTDPTDEGGTGEVAPNLTLEPATEPSEETNNSTPSQRENVPRLPLQNSRNNINRLANRQMNLSRRRNTVRRQNNRDDISEINDLEEGILESEAEGGTNFSDEINGDLEEEAEEGVVSAEVEEHPQVVQPMKRQTKRFGMRGRRKNTLSAMQIAGRGTQTTVQNGQLIARTVPVGTGLASVFVGGNLPLVDGDFYINNIERQVSLSNTNTSLQTNSDSASRTQSNTATRSKTCVKNVSDRNANKWVSYNEELLGGRLDYGKSQGLFLVTTGVFANSNPILIKLAASLRYTHNATTYNKIPVILTPMQMNDVRIASISNFQIPEYIIAGGCVPFSIDEMVLRSGFSQYIGKSVAYGGNWLSSRELGALYALPNADIVTT